MRLSKREQTAILTLLRGVDPEAKVFLFGSRVNETTRGGDIGLLIDFPHPFSLEKVAEFGWKLMEELGEQKFDSVAATGKNREFVNTIKPHAVEMH